MSTSQQDAGTATPPPADVIDEQAQDAPPAAATETGAAAQPPVLSVDELAKQLADSQAHISKLNNENKERRQKLEAFEAKESEAKRATMTEIERLQADLDAASGSAATLETVNGQLEALQAIVTEQVEATVKRLSVPKYVTALLADKSPAEQLAFLNANAAQFTKQPAPDFNGNAGGKKKDGLQMDEETRRRAASAYGVNVEHFK